ncbi:hypothetical protein LTR09_005861 [Extremus antarcticus]|uniref:F-box domain-containing protein n=1 Tax=Extremus antarcticus TaxID=702011 RepID=A0AAJ0DG36_9PEZI|nr:hypothetical protein LTR09_005861 [Extremus antarcticus]
MDPHTIFTARLVCKTWRDLIRRSRDIQYSKVLRPAGFEIPEWMSIPWYEGHFPTKLHPWMIDHRIELDETRFELNLDEVPEEILSSLITSPPCIAVGLQTHIERAVGMLRNRDHHCVVYAPRGVRFQDLWDVEKIAEDQEDGVVVQYAHVYVAFGEPTVDDFPELGPRTRAADGVLEA